jgi:hypothetical protein
MLLKVMFRFAGKLHQIKAAEPGGTARVKTSTLIIFKSEPYMLDAYLGKKLSAEV